MPEQPEGAGDRVNMQTVRAGGQEVTLNIRADDIRDLIVSDVQRVPQAYVVTTAEFLGVFADETTCEWFKSSSS
jgi:hypothetical protein